MPTIAVIDDEAMLCEVIKEALETAKVMVRFALTGALGADMLRRRHFDLALIDVDLPDVSGIALAEVAVDEDAPVVFMSGNLNIVDGLSDWGMPCLEKPFRLTALHAEVERVMDDGPAQLRQTRDALSTLRATMSGLEGAWKNAKRLIDVSRSMLDQAVAAGPPPDG